MKATNAHFKYAEALIKTAKKSDADEAVLNDLKSLNDCFKDPGFRQKMKDVCHLKKEDMVEVMRATFAEILNKISINLLILLGRGKKIELLPRIYEVYARYYFHGKGITQLKVRTARKLTADEEGKLIEQLIQSGDKKVHVDFEQDPKLIAGIQVFQQGYMTDYSVRNYLETLKKQLIS